ncbi:MAG: TonB family protein, partial [Gemmatimonadales bacterium]
APAPEPSKRETSKRDRNKRARPNDSRKAATPPAATPPAARPTGTGTISIHGQPRNATVMIDGVRKTGDRIKVPSGVPHQIEVQAQGFAPLNQSVTVANNQTLSFDATLHAAGAAAAPVATPGAPPGANCAGSPNDFNNSANHCFDSRPVAQTRTEVAAPASCPRSVGNSTLLVHISAAGEVIDQPQVMRPSGCPAFDEIAKAAVQDIAFVPAKKGGQSVIGWLQVVMRPTH